MKLNLDRQSWNDCVNHTQSFPFFQANLLGDNYRITDQMPY